MRALRVAAEITRLDAKGAPLALDRLGAHQRGDARAVERRRHGDEPQIVAQSCLRVERQRQAEIGVERALVIFVEQHAGDALERRIVEDHAREDAFGDDLDARSRRDFRFEAHPQADRFADILAERRRHAARRRAGGETSRLQQNELAALRPVGVEQRERHARGLAGAGRRDDDKIGRRLKRRADLRQHVVDRQRRKIMQHRRRALQKFQIL